MELHLHLSVAFRSLDRKWGKPVDLDTSGEAVPCVPATLEKPTTTFSSEEYLRTIRRPKPYRREETRKRKSAVRMRDSFSNISRSNMESTSDLGSDWTLDDRSEGASLYTGDTVATGNEPDKLEASIEECDDCLSEEQMPKRKKQKLNHIFTQFKESIVGYAEKSRKKLQKI